MPVHNQNLNYPIPQYIGLHQPQFVNVKTENVPETVHPGDFAILPMQNSNPSNAAFSWPQTSGHANFVHHNVPAFAAPGTASTGEPSMHGLHFDFTLTPFPNLMQFLTVNNKRWFASAMAMARATTEKADDNFSIEDKAIKAILAKFSPDIITGAVATMNEPLKMIQHVRDLLQSHFLMLRLATADKRTDGSVDYKNEIVKKALNNEFTRAYEKYNDALRRDKTHKHAGAYVYVMSNDRVLPQELEDKLQELVESDALSQIYDIMYCLARRGNREYPLDLSMN
eukprot:6175483-Pleurochrysis_carterae.AAC.1